MDCCANTVLYMNCISTDLVSLDDSEQEIEGMLACVHSDETTKSGLSGKVS